MLSLFCPLDRRLNMNMETQDRDRRLEEPLYDRKWLLVGTELFSVVMGITELVVVTIAQHKRFSKNAELYTRNGICNIS